MPWWLTVALPLLLASQANAQSPEARLNQTARAFARISMIEPFCGPFFLLDRKKIAATRDDVLRDGASHFGKGPLKQAVNAVLNEMLGELKESGAVIWCPAQREHYETLGLIGLIGDPLR